MANLDIVSPTHRASPRRLAMLAIGAALAATPWNNAAADPVARNRVDGVTSTTKGEETLIRVRGSRTPTFTMYKLDRPSRVVLDVSSAELADGLRGEDAATFAVNTWAVQQVTAHETGEGTRRGVRLVVSLARPSTYDVKVDGRDLVVRVTARERAPVAAVATGMTAQEKAARAQEKLAAQRAMSDARRMMDEATALKRQAEETAAQARRDVADAKAEAERARAEATVRDQQARQRLADAAAMKREASVEMAAATQAKAAAAAEERRARDRAVAARGAETTATARREEARLAAESAERARLAAEAAVAAKQAGAAALERAARQAAATAEKRRIAAESAEAESAKRAEESRRATAMAEQRRAEVTQALEVAEAGKRRAEAERASAEDARKRAELARATAESQASQAVKRASELERAAAEAARRAEAARTVRQAEEQALAKAESARRDAESRRSQAERAKASLEAEMAAVRVAETQAAERRRAASEAERTARAAERDRRSQAEIDRTRAEAQRLVAERTAAEKELAERRGAVESQRKALAALGRERDRAASELGSLEKAADAAKRRRADEEKKLASLASERRAAEQELAAARAQRAELAAERAAADRQIDADRKRAEQELAAARAEAQATKAAAAATRAAAEASRAAAEKDRSEAERARIAASKARGDAEKARAEAERLRASVKTPKPPKTVNTQPAPAATPVPAPLPTPRRSQPTATDVPSPILASGNYGSSSGVITQQSVSQVRGRQKVYRGRKIDLDFKDADIHNLLRLLADVGGVNIVVPDEVKASITVRMRDVPWDQAMEVILSSKGLWYRREGRLIRVAPRKELEAEDEAEAARIRAAVEQEAPEPEVFTLNYSDAKAVEQQLSPLLSPKGTIEIDQRTNSIIVNDIRAHRRRIIDLVQRLDTQTPQIQIEARIVEARTTFIREFGIQWGGNMNMSAAGGNATGLIFPNSVGVAGGAEDSRTPNAGVVTPSDFAVNLPAAVGTGSGGAIGMSLGSVGGNFNLNLRLSALEDTGSVRIISAPKITTSNNIEALIKSGVSIPISVISANGVQTQFVPADLQLRVTPAVSQRDCSVSMAVNVTKNEADFVNTGARGDPSILTKEAQTTILVEDGQTAVIGGIYTRNTGVSYSKVPFFGDIPVLGWFFKSRRENDERSEVLVFITPKITNRAFLRCQ